MEKALKNVGLAYDDVIGIANDFAEGYTSEADFLIEQAVNNIENLTNDGIRDLLLRLTLKSYSFGDVKERASFKAVVAKTLRDEARAREMCETEGTVAAKENKATLAVSAEVLVTEIYNLVASLLKTKLDELHRVVDTLKIVLTTRLSEAKLTTGGQ